VPLRAQLAAGEMEEINIGPLRAQLEALNVSRGFLTAQVEVKNGDFPPGSLMAQVEGFGRVL